MEQWVDDSSGNRDLAKYTMAVTVTLTEVQAHRIRRYEQFGLVKPCRTEGRQRLFSDMQVALIREISQLEGRGVNLEGVRVILAMREGEEV
jgi:MerR family glutamine synthetase transcriptional repressor